MRALPKLLKKKKKVSTDSIKMLSINNKLCVSFVTHTHSHTHTHTHTQPHTHFFSLAEKYRRIHSSEKSVKKNSFFRKINQEDLILPKIRSRRTYSSEKLTKKNSFFRKFNQEESILPKNQSRRTHSSQNSIKSPFFRKFNQEELFFLIQSRRTHSSEKLTKKSSFFRKINQEELILPKIQLRITYIVLLIPSSRNLTKYKLCHGTLLTL